VLSALIEPLQVGDCAFVLPLPITREQFNAVARPGRFAGRWAEWVRYASFVFDAHEEDAKGLVLRRLEPMRSLASRSAFLFVGGAVFADFGRAIESGKRVVALLTHCENEHDLEFMDGFVGPEQLAAAVPEDFTGIIHLSSCRSKNLVPLVKQRAPDCRVGWFHEDEGVQEWISRHSAAFLLLASGKAVTYYDAWVEIEKWSSKTTWQ
jgi:hypothetical protein